MAWPPEFPSLDETSRAAFTQLFPSINLNQNFSTMTPSQALTLIENLRQINPAAINPASLQSIFEGNIQQAFGSLSIENVLTGQLNQLFAAVDPQNLLSQLNPDFLNGFSLDSLKLDKVGSKVTGQLMGMLAKHLERKLALTQRLQMMVEKIQVLENKAAEVKQLSTQVKQAKLKVAEALTGLDLR